MIFVHYIVDPDTFACSHALNDAQSVRIFDQLKGKTDGCITIVNELAFETLRTLIAEDEIDREHVVVVLTKDGKTRNHSFNTFGHLLDDDGKVLHYRTPGDEMMERRGFAIAAKQRIRMAEREEAAAERKRNRLAENLPEPLKGAVQAVTAETNERVRNVGEKIEHGFRTRAEQLQRTNASAETVKE